VGLRDSGIQGVLFDRTARVDDALDARVVALTRISSGRAAYYAQQNRSRGSSATDAKTKELAWLHATTTIVPSYAFGNKTSDVAAYGGAGIEPTGCYYYELDGDAKGGTIHADYTALVAVAEQAPLACF